VNTLQEAPAGSSDLSTGRESLSGARTWECRTEESFLDRGEEVALVRRAQAGDRSAQEQLIRSHVRLVNQIARRYRCRSLSLDDLVQEGILGLMVAIERFDATRGCRLCTYAVYWVRQAIARAVEQNDRLIHVPMQASADLRRLVKLRDAHRRTLGREPTETELAEASGLTEDRIGQLLSMVPDTVSLEAMVGSDQDTSLLDLAEDDSALNPEKGAVDVEYHHHLRQLLLSLQPRERQVLEERFGFGGGHPQTLDELSRKLRISRERVRQIEAHAIRKLRYALRAGQWE
jgi:RNA polymerase primary sigma factor